jgi:hypothetical protein
MSPDQITKMAKAILGSVPSGMEGTDVAQLAMRLVWALVAESPIERQEGVITDLRRGFENAITEGKIHADMRRASDISKQ